MTGPGGQPLARTRVAGEAGRPGGGRAAGCPASDRQTEWQAAFSTNILVGITCAFWPQGSLQEAGEGKISLDDLVM